MVQQHDLQDIVEEMLVRFMCSNGRRICMLVSMHARVLQNRLRGALSDVVPENMRYNMPTRDYAAWLRKTLSNSTEWFQGHCMIRRMFTKEIKLIWEDIDSFVVMKQAQNIRRRWMDKALTLLAREVLDKTLDEHVLEYQSHRPGRSSQKAQKK